MPAEANGAVLAGRYRVLRPLGSGGMASVFLCADERLGREVAVKRLHSASPEDGARRFAREARLGAGLNHENLVTIYDSVADGEGVLIVMEHVPGGTLRDALRRGPLPPPVVARIVRDVAAGLDHAHAHGVIHRDVKPANVLLRDDGVAKVVDLGIAIARDETRITVSGTVLGTGAYMAPEQLEGDPATPATDVYALAAVAYEALAGERARTGKTALEIAHQLATEPPPDLAEVRPDLPAAVARTLRRGLDRDPGRRPRSAGALARELEAGLAEPQTRRLSTPAAPRVASAPPAAHRTPPPPGASRGAAPASGDRRRVAPRPRRGLGVALAAAVTLAAVAVVAIVLLSGGGSPSDDAGPVAQRPEPARTEGAAEPAPATEAPADEESPADEPPAAEAPAQDPPADTVPQAPSAYSVPEPAGSDPDRASQLNSDGYALLQAGRFAEAIPQLEEAVRLSPPGTVDPYGYALFNLGSALRQAGRADDAVQVLERRLAIPNQRGTVRRELELARAG